MVRYLNVQWHFQEPQLGGQTMIRVIFQKMRGIYNNHTTTIYIYIYIFGLMTKNIHFKSGHQFIKEVRGYNNILKWNDL